MTQQSPQLTKNPRQLRADFLFLHCRNTVVIPPGLVLRRVLVLQKRRRKICIKLRPVHAVLACGLAVVAVHHVHHSGPLPNLAVNSAGFHIHAGLFRFPMGTRCAVGVLHVALPCFCVFPGKFFSGSAAMQAFFRLFNLADHLHAAQRYRQLHVIELFRFQLFKIVHVGSLCTHDHAFQRIHISRVKSKTAKHRQSNGKPAVPDGFFCRIARHIHVQFPGVCKPERFCNRVLCQRIKSLFAPCQKHELCTLCRCFSKTAFRQPGNDFLLHVGGNAALYFLDTDHVIHLAS
uniref:Uncharacterized protein n=1 Tax=Ackermannviridae sp. TaxID=2831612 RepID=A0A8S5VW25_9CAUD|nr:MAG TPA: hypothetical protein [Ackermannviridae sp.]